MQLDRFSDVAEGYARYRPTYPDALYAWILSQEPHRNRAWDVGTGNGQVARVLSLDFEEVIATDISASQIARAFRTPNIKYKVCPAEDSGIESSSVNLITVAQAAHWFQMDAFVQEVRRVSVDNALLAVWGYSLFEAEPEVDKIVRQLYDDILQGFWDPHRDLVNRRYADFHLPFPELKCPEFEMRNTWKAEDVLGYLRTWSAANKYLQAHGKDPVQEIEMELLHAFNGRQVTCRTPIFLRAWRIVEV